MTNTIDLSGIWQFRLDADKKGVDEEFFKQSFDDTINLPGTTSLGKKGKINEKKETGTLTDLYFFEGYAWYQKKVDLSEVKANSRLILNLERTRLTTVWIDGKEVGSNNSLTTPHVYDITDFIELGKTEVTLTILVSNVDYPTKGGHLTSPDTQTNWNGIIGEISIHVCAPIYVRTVVTHPDTKNKRVGVDAYIVNTTAETVGITCSTTAQLMDIHGYIGNTLGKRSKLFEIPANRETHVHLDYNLGANPEFWSEHNPRIYELVFKMDNKEYFKTHFGLRNFSTTNKRFTINGKPTFLRGKHDGLVFPLTGAFPTDLSSWIRVIDISKSYGINHYRYHTCCPPEAAFLAADLLGIYMEPQLPFWGTLSGPEDEGHNPVEHEYLVNEGFKMLDAYGNHASFCMMSLGNELWGNKDIMNDILHDYKVYDNRHLYTQGSNNFQHAPLIVDEDDFYVGVRLAPFDRHFRGSYGMCDTPLGHIQTDEPGTNFNYDKIIRPNVSNVNIEELDPDAEIEIQYGTGVKKVKASEVSAELLIPEIPIISHEIGQFCVYPNFREIKKYTGPLRARNFEVFRDRLEAKGMLDEAEDFFMASGKFAVDCYKEELESAARSDLIAGYQILDIQDFQGQGTALVGILDAFMDSKGLVTQKTWNGFCSDAILMACFDSYILKGGSNFHAETMIRYNRPSRLSNAYVNWSLKIEDIAAVQAAGVLHPEGQYILTDGYRSPDTKTELAAGEIRIPDGATDLVHLIPINVELPNPERPYALRLTLSINNSSIENSYDLWLYPDKSKKVNVSPAETNALEKISKVKQIPSHLFDGLPFGAQEGVKPETDENAEDNTTKEKVLEPVPSQDLFSSELSSHNLKQRILITNNLEEAENELKNGRNVLLLPYEVTEAIRGFYCQDFWCYQMFKDICEWMKKPSAVGTMGLLIQNNHPVFKEFPTLKYSTPQWYKIVSHSDCAILDDVTDANYRPIVQMIDNFSRNHKLGILFEGHAYSGKLMVCTTRLSEIYNETEVRAFIKSLLQYLISPNFDPAYRVDFEKLKTIFR